MSPPHWPTTGVSVFGVVEPEAVGSGVLAPLEGAGDSVPGAVDEVVDEAEGEPVADAVWLGDEEPALPQEASTRATAGITISAEIRFMIPMLVPQNPLLACEEAKNRGYRPLPGRGGTD